MSIRMLCYDDRLHVIRSHYNLILPYSLHLGSRCVTQATGVDVNVRFTGIDSFEFTDEVAVFDLLGMQLVHGWLVDPQALNSASFPIVLWLLRSSLT